MYANQSSLLWKFIFFYFFSLFLFWLRLWHVEFPSQGSNLHHSGSLKPQLHHCSNPESLNPCASQELPSSTILKNKQKKPSKFVLKNEGQRIAIKLRKTHHSNIKAKLSQFDNFVVIPTSVLFAMLNHIIFFQDIVSHILLSLPFRDPQPLILWSKSHNKKFQILLLHYAE